MESRLSRVNIKLPTDAHLIKWMDTKHKYVQTFESKWGLKLGAPGQTSAFYYQMDVDTFAALSKVTVELHNMFVAATRHVCSNPSLWDRFGFPPSYWPLAIKSLNRQDKTIHGRFDFSLTPTAIKCYEYNTDSSSCLFECGHSQGKWSEATGLQEVGMDPGNGLFARLVDAWKLSMVDKGTLVHFLRDGDQEEGYHTQYMMSAAQEAGLRCKEVADRSVIDSYSFSEGKVLDEEKQPVTHVWKTWSYTTLFTQWQGAIRTAGAVRLVDICFNEGVTVFEPLWTAITANKALLPVLCELYPNHPNLLKSSWDLTEEMRTSGYAKKPVSGRCGENVSLIAADGDSTDNNSKTLAETGGRFQKDNDVYQELCMLPKIGDQYVQVNTFSVAGTYGGIVLRCSSHPVVELSSETDVCRIVWKKDEEKKDENNADNVKNDKREKKAKFGKLLGMTSEGIGAYSSDYDSVDQAEYPSRVYFRHEVDYPGVGKLYYGFKFQCVEFSRRWLIHALGVTYGDVGMAYDIFPKTHSTRVRDSAHGTQGGLVPWKNVSNGSAGSLVNRPTYGAVIIWKEGGWFKHTGHVGIITEATDEYVRVAEQNTYDRVWPQGADYCRQLPVTVDANNGTYFIHEPHAKGGDVCGWKNLPVDFVPDPIAPLPITNALTGTAIQEDDSGSDSD